MLLAVAAKVDFNVGERDGVYIKLCRTEMKEFYFIYPEVTISVPDISKYP